MGKKKAPSPPAPVVKTYAQQLQETIAAQAEAMPQLLELSRKYAPEWSKLESETETQLAQADIARQQALLPEYLKLQGEFTKGQQQQLQDYGKGFVGSFQQAGGAGTLLSGLQKYAEQQQALGGALSPEEQRMAEQSARAGYAARGTALGQQANLAEVLNRYGMQQARERERQAFAGQTAGFLQQQASPALSLMFGQNIGGQLASVSPNIAAQQQLSGPQYFNPESGLSAQMGSANLNALNQYNLAKFKAQNTKSKGFGQAIGTGLGAVGGFFAGGPAGAVAGANIGGSIGGAF